MEPDLSYYRRRAAEERTRAAGTPDPGIAAIHSRLADLYVDRLDHALLRRPAASHGAG